MNKIAKKKCRCLKGRCFLQSDKMEAESNYDKAYAAEKLYQVSVLMELEEGRVLRKEDWLKSLGADRLGIVNFKQNA